MREQIHYAVDKVFDVSENGLKHIKNTFKAIKNKKELDSLAKQLGYSLLYEQIQDKIKEKQELDELEIFVMNNYKISKA